MTHSFHNQHFYHSLANPDYADTNTGASMTITWTAWAAAPDHNITETYVADTEAKIKELRTKLIWLQTNKGPWVKNSGGVYVPDNPDQSANYNKAADSTFDAGDPVDDAQYDGLRDSIENLNKFITATTKGGGDGQSTGLPTKDIGETILKTDFENIKYKMDLLAAVNVSARYAAHHYYLAHSDSHVWSDHTI